MNAIKEWFLNQPMTETQKRYRMGMPLPLMVFGVFAEIFLVLYPQIILIQWVLEGLPLLAGAILAYLVFGRIVHHISAFVTRAHYLKLEREAINAY